MDRAKRGVAFLWRAALGILCLAASPAFAQEPAATDTVADTVDAGFARGEELTVYVMTMGPGPAFYERFGHNAIRIQDRSLGTDVAYNYGMFSFEQEGFFVRFLRGEMDYWMEGGDGQFYADAYAAADRSVWLQELNLSPDQRADLRDFLERNTLPENRFYRYNYYFDNCSTRVRDAIDMAIGGQLRAETGNIASGTTFREHTRGLTSADPALYSGLMLGLGQPVDREISAWEEMFLPMELRERLRQATIIDAQGDRVPLVLREQTIYERQAPLGETDTATRWPVYTVIGLALAAVIALAGMQKAANRSGGGVFVWLTMIWGTLAGLLGLVLVGLWAFTDHATSYWNENILQFSPLLLLLVIVTPAAARGARWALNLATVLASVVAVLALVGFVAQVFPPVSQANGEIIGLALPVNLAIAYSFVRMKMAREAGGGDPALAAAAEARAIPAA